MRIRSRMGSSVPPPATAWPAPAARSVVHSEFRVTQLAAHQGISGCLCHGECGKLHVGVVVVVDGPNWTSCILSAIRPATSTTEEGDAQ
jgi:hypothetical protein